MFETPDFETSLIANFTFGNLPTNCSRLAICRLVELASLSLLGKIRCISWTKFYARQSTMYFFSSNCSRVWLGGKLLVLFVLVSNTSVVSSLSSAKKKPQQNTEDPLKHINKTVQARKFLNLRVLSNWIRVHFVSKWIYALVKSHIIWCSKKILNTVNSAIKSRNKFRYLEIIFTKI